MPILKIQISLLLLLTLIVFAEALHLRQEHELLRRHRGKLLRDLHGDCVLNHLLRSTIAISERVAGVVAQGQLQRGSLPA